jgi:hypothetical protein
MILPLTSATAVCSAVTSDLTTDELITLHGVVGDYVDDPIATVEECWGAERMDVAAPSESADDGEVVCEGVQP